MIRKTFLSLCFVLSCIRSDNDNKQAEGELIIATEGLEDQIKYFERKGDGETDYLRVKINFKKNLSQITSEFNFEKIFESLDCWYIPTDATNQKNTDTQDLSTKDLNTLKITNVNRSSGIHNDMIYQLSVRRNKQKIPQTLNTKNNNSFVLKYRLYAPAFNNKASNNSSLNFSIEYKFIATEESETTANLTVDSLDINDPNNWASSNVSFNNGSELERNKFVRSFKTLWARSSIFSVINVGNLLISEEAINVIKNQVKSEIDNNKIDIGKIVTSLIGTSDLEFNHIGGSNLLVKVTFEKSLKDILNNEFLPKIDAQNGEDSDDNNETKSRKGDQEDNNDADSKKEDGNDDDNKKNENDNGDDNNKKKDKEDNKTDVKDIPTNNRKSTKIVLLSLIGALSVLFVVVLIVVIYKVKKLDSCSNLNGNRMD